MRFLAGFLCASLIWGGLAFAYSRGLIDISLTPEAPQDDAESAAPPDEAESESDPKRRRRKQAPSARKRPPRVAGESESQSGDADLGEKETRSLDADKHGGEEQLRGTEIERGFDAAFAQIRRCLVLAASDDPVLGKVVFGLRISGQGTVTAVNLRGPSSVTQGECGACLRKAASSMRFRSFNGPDMVVHYPLTLE